MTEYVKLCHNLRKYGFDLISYKMGAEFAQAVHDAAKTIDDLSIQAENAEEALDQLRHDYDMLNMNMEHILKENAYLEEQLDKAVELSGKLVALCCPPREWNDKLFRRHINRPGDYMGSGYDFLDGFNRIFDDFEQNADETLYRSIRNVIEREMEKWRGKEDTNG